MEPHVPGAALAAMSAVGVRMQELADKPSDQELALIALALDEIKAGKNAFAVMYAFRNILEVPFATAVATVKIAEKRLAAEKAALEQQTAAEEAAS